MLLSGTYALPVWKHAARTGQSTATNGGAAAVAAGNSTVKAGRPAGAAGRLDPAAAALKTKPVAPDFASRLRGSVIPPPPVRAAGMFFLKTDTF